MINRDQVKIIHVLKGKLGLSDEHYRDMLATYNASTCKTLSHAQARDFITALHQQAERAGLVEKPPQGAKRFDQFGHRPGMASPAQLRKIEGLWVSVSRQPTLAQKRQALNTFLSNHFGIDRIEWLPQEQVGKIITTITTMQRQEAANESV